MLCYRELAVRLPALRLEVSGDLKACSALISQRGSAYFARSQLSGNVLPQVSPYCFDMLQMDTCVQSILRHSHLFQKLQRAVDAVAFGNTGTSCHCSHTAKQGPFFRQQVLRTLKRLRQKHLLILPVSRRLNISCIAIWTSSIELPAAHDAARHYPWQAVFHVLYTNEFEHGKPSLTTQNLHSM